MPGSCLPTGGLRPLPPARALVSRPPPVEAGPLTGAVFPQCAVRAGRVRAGENPVLPGRQPSEDLGLDGFRTGETVVRLQAGQRVGAEAVPLLDRDADLLRPVDVIGCEGDQADVLSVL